MLLRSNMDCRAIFILIGALLAQGSTKEVKFSGFLGCRFSNAVCRETEQCINDNLFGSCQQEGAELDGYQYSLDHDTLHLLETQITRLVQTGYTWSSLYTQCTVGNILLAFRLGVEPDGVWCDQGGAPPTRYEEALNDDAKSVLADYITDYYGEQSQGTPDIIDDDVIDVDPYVAPDKKDEYVSIHKYFKDKREDMENDVSASYPGPMPIDYGPDPMPMNYQSNKQELDYEPIDVEDLNEEEEREIEQFQEREMEKKEEALEEERAEEELQEEIAEGRLGENLDALLNELRPSDLLLLKSFLQGNEQRQERLDEIDMQPSKRVRQGDEASEGYVWDGPMFGPTEDLQETVEATAPTRREYMAEEMQQAPIESEVPSLSPPDAKLLGDLLQDKVDVDQLSDNQIQRLLNHVDSMLYTLEDIKQQDAEEDEQLNDRRSRVESAGEKRSEVPLIVDTIEPTEALPDPHDHAFDEPMVNPHTEAPKLAVLNTLQGYMHINPPVTSTVEGQQFLQEVEKVLNLPSGALGVVDTVKDGDLIFEVNRDLGMDAEKVAKDAMGEIDQIRNRTQLTLEDAGVGDDRDKLSVTSQSRSGRNGAKYFVLTFVLCGSIAGIVLAVIALYVVKRHSRSKQRLKAMAAAGEGCEASKDYQDLCRQRMQTKTSVKPEVAHQTSGGARVSSVASESAVGSPSSRSSTSSWSEEPVASNMDISTGHIVLSYMEDHLKNKDRLSEEWEALCAYEAEPSTTTVGGDSTNMRKNRYSDVLPYDHSRVVLSDTPNVSGSDYVNANTITDHDPRNPAYIATQGPLPHTVADFWQLVWEQGSVVIVCLSKLTENGLAMCHRYWPEEGSDLYHIYEVHLVSEHIWCDDYLVRSFYLKNLQTNETRTVTQFHFLTWPDLGIPSSAKSLLDFRRKVNKSYRGRSCPIVVHCSDGVGRTGTYCLIDMVLNRMSKGAKEIDIAATLEHIRDQRANTVKTKEQFEFALASVADEVHAILKALPQ